MYSESLVFKNAIDVANRQHGRPVPNFSGHNLGEEITSVTRAEVEEVINAALPLERRSNAHSCGKHYVGLTEIAGEEADVMLVLGRSVRHSGQIQLTVLRLHRDVRVVLLKPIGTMPDPAIARGSNRLS
jgi:hypothetical protein